MYIYIYIYCVYIYIYIRIYHISTHTIRARLPKGKAARVPPGGQRLVWPPAWSASSWLLGRSTRHFIIQKIPIALEICKKLPQFSQIVDKHIFINIQYMKLNKDNTWNFLAAQPTDARGRLPRESLRRNEGQYHYDDIVVIYNSYYQW